MNKGKHSNVTKYFILFGIVIIISLVGYAIYKQYEEYSLKDDPKLKELKVIFGKFFDQDRYWTGNLESLNKRDIMKETDLYRGDKSYTINKERVYLCLKDDDNEYYSLNMLIYVLAHEYSHVISKSIGHTDEWNAIFEQLLVELADTGIYDPSQAILTDYCQHGDKLK
tara:strand:- start:117 stop:620 length:504 start_codon:yes stop_codon:yes gene_type:complete